MVTTGTQTNISVKIISGPASWQLDNILDRLMDKSQLPFVSMASFTTINGTKFIIKINRIVRINAKKSQFHIDGILYANLNKEGGLPISGFYDASERATRYEKSIANLLDAFLHKSLSKTWLARCNGIFTIFRNEDTDTSSVNPNN